uniref:peptidoglycan editing factor PgeF n=1 Tax=Parerythrobacter lutipelagi TaxID=1964208 RepID=UPI0010F990E8|nr:peptidoglycan editing factor PgeF [Parerythrobacter lutipelagi]
MTRSGGVSQGEVAGLQCGFGAGDDDADVRANRRIVSETVLPGARLVTPYQVHSAKAAIVTETWAWENRPQVDAVVTDRPGLLLGIVTADCAPVLLADRAAGVVAAAHAGWRGAHEGVIEATVDAMTSIGADRSRIAAAIGPCIAQASYEVGEDFRKNFSMADDAGFFESGREGHWQFDLAGYVGKLLRQSGVSQPESVADDTYSATRADDGSFRYYSYRRATHRGEANYGRQLSVIGLAGPLAS